MSVTALPQTLPIAASGSPAATPGDTQTSTPSPGNIDTRSGITPQGMSATGMFGLGELRATVASHGIACTLFDMGA